MVHRKGALIAQLIHEGRHWSRDGAYMLAIAEYLNSAKEVHDRIEFASSMFSVFIPAYEKLRQPIWLARAVLAAVPLWRQMRYLKETKPGSVHDADQCETLSSIFAQWSLVPLFGGSSYLLCASSFASRAYVLSNGDLTAHTPVLALCTLARIALRQGNGYRAFHETERAFGRASQVVDPDQQSRAYRSIAEILHQLDRSITRITMYIPDDDPITEAVNARRALALADAVSGISPVTRDKNAQMRRQLGL